MKLPATAPLLLLLVAISIPASVTATVLPEFEASYGLVRGGLRIGTSTLTLAYPESGKYRYESRSWPIKLVSWFLRDRLHETSTGIIDGGKLRPLDYIYKRSGGSKEREAWLRFDWDKLRVENHVEGSHWEMDIPEGTIDKLATQLGIMTALHEGKLDVAFNVADGGTLKVYRFLVIDRETLELPAGKFETVKLARLKQDTRRQTIIWCAPALSYLPVRIKQREKDGARIQIDLEHFSDSLRVKQ